MTAKLQIGASTRSVSLHRRELARARWLASTDTAWTGVEFSVQETTSPLTGHPEVDIRVRPGRDL